MDYLPSTKHKRLIRPYIKEDKNSTEERNCADIRVGDVYLKREWGDREGIPVNYFDLVGTYGGVGHRNHYRFFTPTIVTLIEETGFVYHPVVSFLTPSEGFMDKGRIDKGKPLEGILLHPSENGEIEIFVDKREIGRDKGE